MWLVDLCWFLYFNMLRTPSITLSLSLYRNINSYNQTSDIKTRITNARLCLSWEYLENSSNDEVSIHQKVSFLNSKFDCMSRVRRTSPCLRLCPSSWSKQTRSRTLKLPRLRFGHGLRQNPSWVRTIWTLTLTYVKQVTFKSKWFPKLASFQNGRYFESKGPFFLIQMTFISDQNDR